MKKALTYKLISEVLGREGRQFHMSLGRGVFVLAKGETSYHHVVLTGYPIHAMKGPVVPRLNIDRQWTNNLIPIARAKKWGVAPDNEGLFSHIGLEITVLESQLDILAATVPHIIASIERGDHSEFETLLPFETSLTTSTNIWSTEAREIARKSNRSR